MLPSLILVLVIIGIVIVWMEIRKWFIQRKLRYFESPKQIPILGSAAKFLNKSNDEVISIVSSVYDEVKTTPFQLWFGPLLVVGICEPNDIEIILTDANAMDKPYFYRLLKCESSILVSDTHIWKTDRRLLSSTFNMKILQNYIPLFNDKSRILIQRMHSHLDDPAHLYRTIFTYMIDILTRTTLGTEMHMQSQRGHFFGDIFKQTLNNIQYRVSRYWLRWNFTYALTSVYRDEQQPQQIGIDLMNDVYRQKADEIQMERSNRNVKSTNGTNGRSFFEKCIELELDGVFSRQNVMDQMRLIIFAGIDSSAIAVFETLLMLAINPKHQDLVVDEMRSIFDSNDEDVTQDHLVKMKYMERAIKESMRLFSPVPIIGRKTTADVKLAKGIVPKGTMVIINIMRLHRNPRIWGENANEFDPDRFLPENIAKRPSFSYIPFSAGPRNCIGMKYAMNLTKITLAHLLRQFKFTTDLRFEDIRLKLHLVLEITNENPLRIEQRTF